MSEELQRRLAIVRNLKVNAVSMYLFEAACRFRSYERKILRLPEQVMHTNDFLRLRPQGWAINVEALENLDLGTHWAKLI